MSDNGWLEILKREGALCDAGLKALEGAIKDGMRRNPERCVEEILKRLGTRQPASFF